MVIKLKTLSNRVKDNLQPLKSSELYHILGLNPKQYFLGNVKDDVYNSVIHAIYKVNDKYYSFRTVLYPGINTELSNEIIK